MLTQDYNDLYTIPQEIVYPTTSEALRLDTTYANLNSEDFNLRESEKCNLPAYFDFIDRNDDQHIIIAANDASILIFLKRSRRCTES